MTNTILLNLFTMFVVFVISIPLGIATAVRKNGVFDKAVQVVTIVDTVSPPSSSPCLRFYLRGQVPHLPDQRPANGRHGCGGIGWSAGHTLAYDAACSRHVGFRYRRHHALRACLHDRRAAHGLYQNARAKGLREKTVIYIHAFRNALIPIVTITTWWIIGLFGGSIVIESVFLIPGLGKMLIDALMQRDFAVVLTMQMFYVILSLAGNVLMDIAYTLVDPRVRLEN